MTNQGAFGELQVRNEQIEIAATLKIPKQIFLIAQNDTSLPLEIPASIQPFRAAVV
jgi:hypothetical protein